MITQSHSIAAEILFSHPNVFVYLQRLPLERTETSSISRGGESGRHYSNQCLNIGQILMHNHTPRTNIENIHVEQTSHTNKNRNRHKNRIFCLFSAQKWHWKYCSRIPLEYWPSRGLWMSRAVSRVHYSDSWRLHKCTDLCRQMHRSVSMSYVKICVDVTQYVKLLDLAKSQSGVTHSESIWSGQVIFEDG